MPEMFDIVGFYLYANGTGQLYKTARLLSAREISPGQYCIAMHYFIMGNTSATLTLRAYDYVIDHESTLSSRSDNHGSNIDGGWYEYLTEYTNTSHKWRVSVFECKFMSIKLSTCSVLLLSLLIWRK